MVVTIPLIALAVPSVIAGAMYAGPMLFGDHFGSSIVVLEEHDVLAKVSAQFHGAISFALHGLVTLPFWLAVSGVAVAWYLYLYRPDLPQVLHKNKQFVTAYPELLSQAADTWVRVDGVDKRTKERNIFRNFRRGRSLMGLVGDAYKIARAFR